MTPLSLAIHYAIRLCYPLLDGQALNREALVELILQYVDGIIYSKTNSSEELIAAIEGSGKSVLDFQSDDQLIESVADFYNSIIGEEEEEESEE